MEGRTEEEGREGGEGKKEGREENVKTPCGWSPQSSCIQGQK